MIDVNFYVSFLNLFLLLFLVFKHKKFQKYSSVFFCNVGASKNIISYLRGILGFSQGWGATFRVGEVIPIFLF